MRIPNRVTPSGGEPTTRRHNLLSVRVHLDALLRPFQAVSRMPKTLSALSIADLHFDPANPRLPEYVDSHDEAAVIEYLLLETNLIELMLSIGAQGYFAGEPLLVVPRPAGGWTVVEGNRRLGALKLLSSDIVPTVLPKQVEAARAEAKERPVEVPALQFDERSEILSYLGYRHITGIKEWDHLAKARYLRQLRERHRELDNDAAHKLIAREIGSNASQVAKLLTGLTLMDRARDAGILNELALTPKDIPFSLLTTGIGYKDIATFIGLKGASDVEALDVKGTELRELFAWVFAKNPGQRTVLGESRHFPILARVVASERALASLRRGASLDVADLETSGPLEAFREHLHRAESSIRIARESLSLVVLVEKGDYEQSEQVRRAAIELSGAIRARLEAE